MADAIAIDQFARMAIAVLNLAAALGTLLPAERRVLRWVLIGYESAPLANRKYHKNLVEQLRQIIQPPKIRLTLEQYLDRVTRNDEQREATRKHLSGWVAFYRKSRVDRDGKEIKGLSPEDALAAALEDFGEPTERAKAVHRGLDELEKLEAVTVAFVELAETLGRSLMEGESRAFHFIWKSWQAPEIKAQCLLLTEEECKPYDDLIHQLRAVLQRDPIEVLRIQRKKPTAVAELHGGNYQTKAPFMQGVRRRRMNAREATDRIDDMVQRCEEIPVLARELSLVLNRDRPAVARMVKRGKIQAREGLAFGERCKKTLESVQCVVAVPNLETGEPDYVNKNGTRQPDIEKAEKMGIYEGKKLAKEIGGTPIGGMSTQQSAEELMEDMRIRGDWLEEKTP